MISVFFALSPALLSHADYANAVSKMASHFNLKPIYPHLAPIDTDPAEWIASALSTCDYAVFDFTGYDASVLFAYGIALQNDDVTIKEFISTHQPTLLQASAYPLARVLLSKIGKFGRPDDFAREAQMFIGKNEGSSKLLGDAFIARVKKAIKVKGPIHMRQLAKEVSRPMVDLQPLVYELVREGKVRKISDKRWAQYESLESEPS